MSRISVPATIETSPVQSQPFLGAVKQLLGSVPNLFRMVGNSPAALEGYLGLNGALAKAFAKLDDVEITTNRTGSSGDTKAAAAVTFAVKIANQKGRISEADLKAVQAIGYSDAEVLEIIAHVALNTLTNYVNNVTRTEIDFPVVATLKSAA